jgi:hypothetical protein
MALGTPAKTVIQGAASGTKAWVTSLTGQYNANEKSVLLSPFYNFSSLTEDPILRMKVWVDTEGFFDGACVGWTANDGNNIGIVGGWSPTSIKPWYNSNHVDALQSFISWPFDGFTGSTGGWLDVEVPIIGTKGLPKVVLGITFASNWGISGDGLAVDDIGVYPGKFLQI